MLLPHCFLVHDGDLRLRSVQYFLELTNTMPHPRMHVSLGAFDVVMQVIAEVLDMTDSGFRSNRIDEMARE